MENNEKIISKLNHLVSMANDGKYGYENAAKDVKDVGLQQMFTQYSNERGRYAEDLKNEVAALGGSPDKGGGPLGALHRTWMDIKSAITSGDREAIVAACVTGEEAAVKAYTDVLDDTMLTGNTRQLVTSQLGGIQAALSSIRSLIPASK